MSSIASVEFAVSKPSSGASRPDHDQRFKILLEHFLDDFLKLFLPRIALLYDTSSVQWLTEKAFLDPPSGRAGAVDLVARLRRRDLSEDRLLLIHIDVEASNSVADFGRRMHAYYAALRQRHNVRVLPVGLFLSVGGEGIEWATYREPLEEVGIDAVIFRYLHVGLPKLEAQRYLDGEVPLGYALAALMKQPAGGREGRCRRALERIAASGLNELQEHLLIECATAYWPLDPDGLRRVQAEVESWPPSEGRAMIESGLRDNYAGMDEDTRKQIVAELAKGLRARLIRQVKATLTDDEKAEIAASLIDDEKAEIANNARIDDITRILTKRFGGPPSPTTTAALKARSAEDLSEFIDRAFMVATLEQFESEVVGSSF